MTHTMKIEEISNKSKGKYESEEERGRNKGFC
jgi:hypothetical protein